MKKELLAITAVTITMMMAGCSGNGKSAAGDAADSTNVETVESVEAEEPAEPQLSETNPEDVVRMLLDCCVANDFESIPKYLKAKGSIAKREAAMLAYACQQNKGLSGYNITDCKVNGNTATVRYTLHFNSGSNEKDKFTLQRMDDGTWKVWK